MFFLLKSSIKRLKGQIFRSFRMYCIVNILFFIFCHLVPILWCSICLLDFDSLGGFWLGLPGHFLKIILLRLSQRRNYLWLRWVIEEILKHEVSLPDRIKCTQFRDIGSFGKMRLCKKLTKTSHACVPLTTCICCRLLIVTPNHGIIFARALTVSDRDDESTRRERYGSGVLFPGLVIWK